MVHEILTNFSQGLAIKDYRVIPEKGQPGDCIWYGKLQAGLLK